MFNLISKNLDIFFSGLGTALIVSFITIYFQSSPENRKNVIKFFLFFIVIIGIIVFVVFKFFGSDETPSTDVVFQLTVEEGDNHAIRSNWKLNIIIEHNNETIEQVNFSQNNPEQTVNIGYLTGNIKIIVTPISNGGEGPGNQPLKSRATLRTYLNLDGTKVEDTEESTILIVQTRIAAPDMSNSRGASMNPTSTDIRYNLSTTISKYLENK